MATILYGNEWSGDDAPSAGVLPGQSWVKPTSGDIYRRDASNTTWVYFGSINNQLGGAVQKAGDTMTGPLLDAPNLPPLDDPDFTGTIKQGGLSVALNQQIAANQRAMYDRITYQVREQFLSLFKQSGTAANVIFEKKSFTLLLSALTSSGVAVPLPTFLSDGIVATPDQLMFYTAVPRTVVGGSDSVWDLEETAPGSRIFKYTGIRAWEDATCHVDTYAFAVR